MKVCERLYSGVEMRLVMNRAKSRSFGIEWSLTQECPLSPLLFNIYLMEMVKKLERAQLEVCWCGR